MEAFPPLTVNYYNLIYVCVKQAWLYNVLCIKPCDLNCCIANFCNLKFCSESAVSDIVKISKKKKKRKKKKRLSNCFDYKAQS